MPPTRIVKLTGDGPYRQLVTVDSAYTAEAGDRLLVDTTGGPVLISLPDPETPGAMVSVKNTGPDPVTVSGPVDGVSSLTVPSAQQSVDFLADGSAWHAV